MAPQTIPDGFALIAGRGRDNARAALKAADDAGLEANVVRATTGGYLVPVKVLDFYEAPGDVEAEIVASTETEEGTDGTSTEAGSTEAQTAEAAAAEATGDDDTAGTADDEDTADTADAAATGQTETAKIEQPPKSGAGSGEEAWVAWAKEAHGYQESEGLSRNEIIAKFAV